MPEIKVYALDEVAAILKVTRRTLYSYVHAGTMKAFKMGKYWRVSEGSLVEFISAGAPVVDANRRPANRTAGPGAAA
jgi:excisionase family DNA binding protein